MDLTLTSLLTLANFVLVVGGLIGGWLAIRSALTKSAMDVSARVREDLSAENELLQSQVKRQGGKITRLERVIDLLITAFEKMYGVKIEVDEETVTIRTSNGTHVSRITSNNP